MTLDELKTRVKIKVDEYTPSGVSHSFDDYLEPMIQESADELTDKAPKHLFDATALLVTAIKYDDDLAYIPVPTGYARLFSIKFPKWSIEITIAISPSHPDYAKQKNAYTKAGYGRPVVMFNQFDPEGEDPLAKYLVCGKVLEDVGPTYAYYIAYADAEDMPSVLDEALTWLAASKILQILDDATNAQIAYTNHQAELQNKSR